MEPILWGAGILVAAAASFFFGRRQGRVGIAAAGRRRPAAASLEGYRHIPSRQVPRVERARGEAASTKERELRRSAAQRAVALALTIAG